MAENIEKIFYSDSCEKKRIAHGEQHNVRHKSKRNVSLPFETIDGRTKAGKLYKGNGEITISYLTVTKEADT